MWAETESSTPTDGPTLHDIGRTGLSLEKPTVPFEADSSTPHGSFEPSGQCVVTPFGLDLPARWSSSCFGQVPRYTAFS